MAADSRVMPLVVILGSTGTGKTKLSLELAKRYGGEVISADSMQVYRGLDIVTAKATREEQSQAPHHLLDVATPDQAFTVIHFREMVLPIIDRLLESGRMPIVVGGTNYYIESVLWQVLVGSGIRTERGRRRTDSPNPCPSPSSSSSETINQQKRVKLATDYEADRSVDGGISGSSRGGEEQRESGNDGEKVQIVGHQWHRCVNDDDHDNNRVAEDERHADALENESGLHLRGQRGSAESECEAKKVRDVSGDGVAERAEDRGVEGEEDEDAAAAAAAAEVNKVLLMTTEEMEQLESPVLHRVLRRVDSVTADRLHPNNKRKIVRALEVLQQDGQPLSRILDEQRGQAGGCNLGGPLRYRKVVIFWLRCEQETLNTRLNDRVDSMVAQGLLAEIRAFSERYVKPYENNDFHRGILQSIGFKEFVGYLDRFDADHDQLITEYIRGREGDGDATLTPPEGLPLLERCLDNLKLVTQRYSKKQIKWINHRFLANARREVPPIYALDTTDVSKWTENVSTKAQQVIDAVLAGVPSPIAPVPKITSPREGLNEETSFHCQDCQRTIVGEYQWHLHLRSNKHKKCIQRKFKTKQVLASTVTTPTETH